MNDLYYYSTTNSQTNRQTSNTDTCGVATPLKIKIDSNVTLKLVASLRKRLI